MHTHSLNTNVYSSPLFPGDGVGGAGLTAESPIRAHYFISRNKVKSFVYSWIKQECIICATRRRYTEADGIDVIYCFVIKM